MKRKRTAAGAGLLVGHARVSTHEQSIDLQRDALKKAGCGKIFADTISGSVKTREGLERALAALRDGDTLVVWKLDRLGRSLSHLVGLIHDLQGKSIGFRSLQETIDTTSGVGKLVFHIFASLAEFERDLIRERTLAGIASARARGRLSGRPKLLDAKKVALARVMHADKQVAINDICATLGIGRTTLYRYLNAPPGRGSNHAEVLRHKTLRGRRGADAELRHSRARCFSSPERTPPAPVRMSGPPMAQELPPSAASPSIPPHPARSTRGPATASSRARTPAAPGAPSILACPTLLTSAASSSIPSHPARSTRGPARACSRAPTPAAPGAPSIMACPTPLTSAASPSIPPHPARSTRGPARACSRAPTPAAPGAGATAACPTAPTSPRSSSIPSRPARFT